MVRRPRAGATEQEAGDEVPVTLDGGNVSTAVVRIGDTVRKPAGRHTPAVHALLTHLAEVGFRHAPRSHGVDDDGRHVLEWVPGRMAHPAGPPVDAAAVGRLLRALHDALDGWTAPADAVWDCPVPTDGEDLVVHNDVAPWNLVLAEDRMVLIDWDASAPGTRGWDLAYAAHGFVPLGPGMPLRVAGDRLCALADGYGLGEAGRHRLAQLLGPRAWSMHTLLEDGRRTGTQPWARLAEEGHADVWRDDATWIETHRPSLQASLLA
ncbi:kinase [Actinotalea ferrariae CF5-4]|uniref:Kinase n=1 Tax=Actinotalea ferrariae CF5-4 TaxID=948458 RepID=A0A021VSZ7_9CELL|nr:phosphotransferase [Actinotalea ferrariae]EYR64309.1 kinase [Actinotalea ferrariae CF5-4]